jgi:hypothetical protein
LFDLALGKTLEIRRPHSSLYPMAMSNKKRIESAYLR